MNVSEKVAHLKGIVEGMEYDTSTKEGKIIGLIIDLLQDISDDLTGLDDDVETLYDFADELDEDLGAVESALFGDDDGDYECDCEDCLDDESDEDGCGCEHCSPSEQE